ncbi:MAG: hypothetical protein KJO54_00085 [Gammaproteobacteria bacterium]|nr:hypothetical protein [Gammaproteobacteria bacterium]
MFVSAALDKTVDRVTHTSESFSFASFFDLLCARPEQFSEVIAAHRAAALFWELPPLTRERLSQPFECVLAGSTALAGLTSDPVTFAEYFSDGREVAVFENLGGDAMLVAPAAQPAGAQYPHLAAFCRSAPKHMLQQFWQQLALAALGKVATTPVWISTAGLGIGWLHARLDSRPKYYSHAPYRRWPQ